MAAESSPQPLSLSPTSHRSPARLDKDICLRVMKPTPSPPCSSSDSPSFCASVASAASSPEQARDHHPHSRPLLSLEEKEFFKPWLEDDDVFDSEFRPQSTLLNRRDLMKLMLVIAAICFDWKAYRAILSKSLSDRENPLAADSLRGSDKIAIESPVLRGITSTPHPLWLGRIFNALQPLKSSQSADFLIIFDIVDRLGARICTYGTMLVAFTAQAMTPATPSCSVGWHLCNNATSMAALDTAPAADPSKDVPRSHLDGTFTVIIAFLGFFIFVVMCL